MTPSRCWQSQLADMQVTRAQTPDLMAITAPTMPVPAVAAIPSASSVLAARVPTGTTQEVSQELKTAQAIAIANRNKMRLLTEGVVAGLYAVTAINPDRWRHPHRAEVTQRGKHSVRA